MLLPPAQNQRFMIAGRGYADHNPTPTNKVAASVVHHPKTNSRVNVLAGPVVRNYHASSLLLLTAGPSSCGATPPTGGDADQVHPPSVRLCVMPADSSWYGTGEHDRAAGRCGRHGHVCPTPASTPKHTSGHSL